MNRYTVCLLSFLFVLHLVGCATVAPPAQPVPPAIKEIQLPKKEIKKKEVVPLEQAEEESILLGKVFAKTIFEGVVKTSFVQLSIFDQSDPDKIYQLYIGDKTRQQSFPWHIHTVHPGYFFIELPPGSYRISSISIPVGTAVATEPMDIVFQVQDSKILYLGTLKVVGEKEKIKLGGVPIIKPGFEYSIEITDDRQEAFAELQARFPDWTEESGVLLMKSPAAAKTE
ncbi:MAG: hypothetical protein KAJ18_09415 [Candidatus Omnitrophica bacterium]|nr:hypothetical protein [Candidatus Omnitrophota bacterium]